MNVKHQFDGPIYHQTHKYLRTMLCILPRRSSLHRARAVPLKSELVLIKVNFRYIRAHKDYRVHQTHHSASHLLGNYSGMPCKPARRRRRKHETFVLLEKRTTLPETSFESRAHKKTHQHRVPSISAHYEKYVQPKERGTRSVRCISARVFY